MESGPYLGNIVEHRINEHIYCTWARHQEWSPPPVIILEIEMYHQCVTNGFL